MPVKYVQSPALDEFQVHAIAEHGLFVFSTVPTPRTRMFCLELTLLIPELSASIR